MRVRSARRTRSGGNTAPAGFLLATGNARNRGGRGKPAHRRSCRATPTCSGDRQLDIMGTLTETHVAPEPTVASPTGNAPPRSRPPGAPAQRRNRRSAIALATLALGVGIVVIWHTLRSPNGAPVLEASGTVKATEANLGFAASGRVHVISVREGETARVGSVLAELDTTELMARVRQLRDQAQLAAAQLRDLEQGARRSTIGARRPLQPRNRSMMPRPTFAACARCSMEERSARRRSRRRS